MAAATAAAAAAAAASNWLPGPKGPTKHGNQDQVAAPALGDKGQGKGKYGKGKKDKKDIDCMYFHQNTCLKGPSCEHRHNANISAADEAKVDERIAAFKDKM